MCVTAWDSQDYANPKVSHLLKFYPEETDGRLTEFWEAQRLKEMPPDLLTPMFRKGIQSFYVNELAEMANGNLVIPHMWIIRNKVVCADACRVIRTVVSALI